MAKQLTAEQKERARQLAKARRAARSELQIAMDRQRAKLYRSARGPMTPAQKARANELAKARRQAYGSRIMIAGQRRAARVRNMRANFGLEPLADPYSVFTEPNAVRVSGPMTEATKAKLRAYKEAKKAAKAGTYTDKQLAAHAAGAARLRAYNAARSGRAVPLALLPPPPAPWSGRAKRRGELEILSDGWGRKRQRMFD